MYGYKDEDDDINLMVDLESLEIVDEDVGEPEMIDQLDIYWDHGSGVV